MAGNDLRSLALEVRNRVADTPAVVAVVGGTPEKPSVVVVTTEGARNRGLKAGDLVRAASETLGGRGGGKDDIAQGGGTDGSRAADALKAVEAAIGDVLQASDAVTATFRRGVRLAVDWGDVRIGVAACDADGLLAYPLTTVAAGPDEVADLAALVAEHGPSRCWSACRGRWTAARARRRRPPGSAPAGWRRPSAYRSGWSTSGSPR